MRRFSDSGEKRAESMRPMTRRVEQPMNAKFSRRIGNYRDTARPTKELPSKTDYSRPTGWPAGMRDKVWENAKDSHGRVRDPLSGKYMSKDQKWDMGHKPGYEFAKHQKSAEMRGIDRETFRKEYYNEDHYRPELPSSNRSHRGEDKTSSYFGD